MIQPTDYWLDERYAALAAEVNRLRDRLSKVEQRDYAAMLTANGQYAHEIASLRLIASIARRLIAADNTSPEISRGLLALVAAFDQYDAAVLASGV